MEKQCGPCGRVLNVEQFETGRLQCRECRRPKQRAAVRAWRQLHPEQVQAAAYSGNRSLAVRYAALKQAAKKADQALSITKAQHAELLGMPCHYCGLSTNETGTGLDRKEPGGPYSWENVVPACWWCNAKKANLFTYAEMCVLGRTIREIRLARGH